MWAGKGTTAGLLLPTVRGLFMFTSGTVNPGGELDVRPGLHQMGIIRSTWQELLDQLGAKPRWLKLSSRVLALARTISSDLGLAPTLSPQVALFPGLPSHVEARLVLGNVAVTWISI